MSLIVVPHEPPGARLTVFPSQIAAAQKELPFDDKRGRPRSNRWPAYLFSGSAIGSRCHPGGGIEMR
ncbi:hypothetical protein, partial [Agrobacterium pusense]|uniref:hypothetical protein n=1 Tax=Agrobacterium pusense TaxID=648995 RepID=UPI001AEEAFDE